MDLAKQYDDFAADFSRVHDVGENSNRDNRQKFYSVLNFIKPGMKLLDLACGDGLDLVYYKSLGAEVYGLDASAELIKIAKERLPADDIVVGLFDQTHYADASFDVILSKYAIQTSADMASVFKEIARIIKPGGILVYLVTHPFRQYFEKKNSTADYFQQEVVEASILNNSIIVREPSHTFNEYFTAEFLNDFDIQLFQEQWDASAEQIDGKKYPGYFIVKAQKRI